MNSKEMRQLPDYIIIGQITRPHGVRGEVKVMPHTDRPERFKPLKRVYLTADEKNRTAYGIQGVRIGPRFVIVKLESVDTPEQAELIKKAYIEIPRRECLPLREGKYYFFELVGLTVATKRGEIIGTVKDILDYPAHDIYVVDGGEKDYLIPDVPGIIDKIDTDSGEMIIDPLDGLLDL